VDAAARDALDQHIHRLLHHELNELARMSQLVDQVHAQLAEMGRRLGELERHLGPRSFGHQAVVESRRRAILEARSRGMSVNAIAAALQVGRRAVLDTLKEASFAEPPIVMGLDGRAYRNRRAVNGDRPRPGVASSP
jgi:hypothetical protein